MEKGSTKEQILEAALELFSIKGFEATSISQIADMVGIRKASLYSHFSNKQDILDTLVNGILAQYNRRSIFSEESISLPEGNWEAVARAVANQIKGQIKYIVNDPHVSKARKMLIIEQFQNPELSQLQSKQSYEDVLQYNTELMKYLIKKNVIEDADPEILAAQFCFPVSMWTNVCDREPEKLDEVLVLIEKHVLQFFQFHKK